MCAAEEVVIEIDGTPQAAAYGTSRADTAAVCGDTDTGFGLLFNWNLLGDGKHWVVALVDGVELDRALVTVTTLGEEFVRDVAGTCVLADFPAPGETVRLSWQEAQQNFVLTDGAAPPADQSGRASVLPPPCPGCWRIPVPRPLRVALGCMSGWVCDAEEVVIEIDELPLVAAYGTSRADTAERCGDTDNGFGLLFNWNLLGDGEHTVVAVVDGVELGRATVTVTHAGRRVCAGERRAGVSWRTFRRRARRSRLTLAGGPAELCDYGRGVRCPVPEQPSLAARLAAHIEEQPAHGRPAGATSTPAPAQSGPCTTPCSSQA